MRAEIPSSAMKLIAWINITWKGKISFTSIFYIQYTCDDDDDDDMNGILRMIKKHRGRFTFMIEKNETLHLNDL